jgi:hypothetical protein
LSTTLYTGLVARLPVHVEERVALLARAAVGNVHHDEALVVGRGDDVEALRVRGVLEDQLVLRLRRADLVEVDLVVLVLRGQLLALLGRVVAAVVEAAAGPGEAGDLDPVQLVGQLLARRHLHHVAVAPVRPARGLAIGGVLRVARDVERAELRRSLGRELVGVEEDLGRPVDPLLVVDDGLVLEPVVLREEPVVAAAVGRAEARVVVELGQAVFDLRAEGNLVEVGEGQPVLLLDPACDLGLRGVVFEPAVWVGDLHAEVVVDLLDLLRRGVLKFLRAGRGAEHAREER